MNEQLQTWDVLALAAGGFVSGVVNSMAGGGSFLTVPLLVMTGLPGTIANGTNRVGVLVQSAVAAWRFRQQGVSGFVQVGPVLVPMLVGSWVGAIAISRVAPKTFEHLFGLVMLVLLLPVLRAPAADMQERQPWPRWLSMTVFFAIGLYGGAFQAGVGVFLILALARAGHGLVISNSIKAISIAAFTLIAASVFVLQGQVAWAPATVLAVSTAAGADLGTRWAVWGGDAVIRPFLVFAVVLMAGRMLGLY
jgi:uncharacterized membrane protein YfcA